MPEKLKEIKISIFHKDDSHWHVILQHEDGSEEISHQGYPTKEACEAAIQQYVEDCKGKLQRFQ